MPGEAKKMAAGSMKICRLFFRGGCDIKKKKGGRDMFDILIKNGTVVDGSGAPGYRADVAVKDGKVARIAPNIDGEARETLDATGLIVSPGFIDCHTHSDSFVFRGSDAYNYLEQGVTTQIAGNCGSSPAPLSPQQMAAIHKNYSPMEAIFRVVSSSSPAAFMRMAEKASLGTNMAFFIGHNPIRSKFVGECDVKPTAEQLSAMQDMVVQAMEAGYLGYSSGLVYTPSVYADTDELIALAKVMAPYGGIYASHIRGEGDFVERAVEEAIAVGQAAGVAVHISHLKVMGLHNTGKADALLKQIDEANRNGVTVTADQYPYTASSASLASQIPPKYGDGGKEAQLQHLQDSATREKILHDIFCCPEDFESGIYHAGFDGVLITNLPKTKEYVNRTLGEIAKTEGKEPIDVLCDILVANDNGGSAVYFNQSPSDLIRILEHPRVFCGSDNSDMTGARKEPETLGGRHPRAMGTMVRRLELVRDFRLSGLEEAVRRITSAPAQAMHLAGQGLLKEGWDANITVFSYEDLHAKASYEKPFRENEGIVHVLVNGTVALRHGKFTGNRAGKVLKRG